MKIALLFPGQGSQYSGMGKSLCQEFPVANRMFEEASDVLGIDMKKLCFGNIYELTKTVNAQPAIFTVSLAAYQIYMQEIGLKPTITAGHSLGEYSALVASGVLTFAEGLKLVRRRGEIMQSASESGAGGMISVFHSDLRQLEQICIESTREGHRVVIACYNSKSQQVLSGQAEGIRSVISKLEQFGMKYSRLNVSAAFHSPMMLEVANQMAVELEKYRFGSWSCEIISNVDALPYLSMDEFKKMLILQMTHPVRWLETMEYVKKNKVDLCIELGPKTVLHHLLKGFDHHINSFTIGTSEDLHEIQSFLSQQM